MDCLWTTAKPLFAWRKPAGIGSPPVFRMAIVSAGRAASQGFAQHRVIELEVHTDARARVGTQQRWMEMLHQVGADRVVMKTGSISEPLVEESKLSSSTLVTISGAIAGEKLFLPGGAFSIRDKDRGFVSYCKESETTGQTLPWLRKKLLG